MKRIAFWYWMIPSTIKPGKLVKSTYRMDEATAQQRFPGCVKAPNQSAPEWRNVYEPGDEIPSNTKPFDPAKGY